MLKNLLFISKFIVTLFALMPTLHCTLNSQFERQLKFTDEDIKINETDFINESEGSNTISALNETLHPILADMNTTETIAADINVENFQDIKPEGMGSCTTEGNAKEQKDTSTLVIAEPVINTHDPTYEDKKQEVSLQESNDYFQIHEKLILPRNNCNSEIVVHEEGDIKLMIKFGTLKNNSYGKCCLTLRGSEKSMLGVLISGVHLYRNNTQGEVLKVVIGDHYSAYVLKEYFGSKDYEPLLLTETHKVYIILYYKVEHIPLSQDGTHFNLEVFTYHKYENNIQNKKHNGNHLHASYMNYEDEAYHNKETPYYTTQTELFNINDKIY